MDPLVIGLAAALAASLVVCLVLLGLLVRRRRRHADARVTSVVDGLEQRLDELARELTETVSRAEEETRRSRFLTRIGTTMDLDDLVSSTLEAASALPGVDAALVRLDGGEGEPVVMTSGFDGDEPEAVAPFVSPDGWAASAVELSFRYRDGDSAGAVRAALGVPLLDSEGRVGWLGVFSRADGGFGDGDLRRLEELAERVAPAVANARRFREVRELADLDALTGLHNRRYFHETLAREVARAQRYNRRLALVLVDVDDFKEINDRIGHLAGDAVLAETAERIRDVVRSADIPCRVGGDELGVIVPESGLEEARNLVERLQEAVHGRPIARAGRVRISAGVAELKQIDDATSLFERADESLYSAKRGRAKSSACSTD